VLKIFVAYYVREIQAALYIELQLFSIVDVESIYYFGLTHRFMVIVLVFFSFLQESILEVAPFESATILQSDYFLC
jgi:hypothetical protein